MAFEETVERHTGAPAKNTAARSTKTQTTKTIGEQLESAPKQVQASYALLVKAAMEQRRKAGRCLPSGLDRFLPSTGRPE